MKVGISALLMLLLFTACEQKRAIVGDTEGKVLTITGKIENPQANKAIYFYELTNDRQLLDSVKADEDGEFSIQVRVNEPSYYGLNIYTEQNPNFILSSDNITIKAAGVADGAISISGSKENDLLQEYWAMKDELQEKSKGWQKRAYDNPSTAEQQLLLQEQQAYATGYIERIKSLINKMDGSLATVEVASELDLDQDIEMLIELAEKVEKKNPTSPISKEFKVAIDNISRVVIGRMAPEIVLENLKGETVKLSDFRGKYVLVDFWASWCQPCRIENPAVRKVYQQYGGKNFEILGVSLDDQEYRWRQAVKEDEIDWPQVRDTKKEAARTYNATSIPFTVLVDRDGKVIDKNLRGTLLKFRLDELLKAS